MTLPRRHHHRHGRAGRLPAFTVSVLLRDETEIVATAYLRSIADNNMALYEVCLYGVNRGDVMAMLATETPEHSLLRLRCLPSVIDLR